MANTNTSKIQQVLDKVIDIEHSLDKHIEAQKERDEKVDKLYEVVVTGNGELSHAERLRMVERYQAGQRKAVYFVSAIVAGDLVLRFWQLLVH